MAQEFDHRIAALSDPLANLTESKSFNCSNQGLELLPSHRNLSIFAYRFGFERGIF